MKSVIYILLIGTFGVGTVVAEEAPDQLEVADTDCDDVIAKTANGEELTPAEGDLLLNCFIFPSFDPDNPGGWQANHPPGSLYDEQYFIDVPGVMGGGMVRG